MKVNVHVSFNSGSSKTEIVSLPTLSNVANVSNLNTRTSSIGSKGFQLSPSKDKIVSTLEGDNRFYTSNGYIGVMSREISNVDRVFSNPVNVKIRIYAQTTDYVYIIFDRALKEYAHIFTLSDTFNQINYTNNLSSIIEIPLSNFDKVDDEYYDLTMSITEWSHPFTSAKITYVSSNYAMSFTGSSILDIVWSEHSMDSQVTVLPGIVEQYANVSLYDRLGSASIISEHNLFSEGAKATIEVLDSDNNVIDENEYLVADWDISADSRLVDFTCADPTVAFSKISVSATNVQTRSIHDFLTLVFEYVPKYTWKYIDTEVQNYCEQTIIPNSWSRKRSVDESLRLICASAMLRICWLKNTFVVLRSW